MQPQKGRPQAWISEVERVLAKATRFERLRERGRNRRAEIDRSRGGIGVSGAVLVSAEWCIKTLWEEVATEHGGDVFCVFGGGCVLNMGGEGWSTVLLLPFSA